MWLALCDPRDPAGLWCVAGLRRLGVEPLEVITPAELAAGTALSYRVGAGALIELTDGRRFEAGAIRGVLNRLPWMVHPPRDGLSTANGRYVEDELTAALAALLFSLGPIVVNPPGPVALGGPALTEAEWRLLASKVGLPARPLRRASWDDRAAEPSHRTLAAVVGDHVIGAAGAIEGACLELSRAAGAPMLGLAFDQDGRFETAFPQPDLRDGGPAALAALARALGAAP